VSVCTDNACSGVHILSVCTDNACSGVHILSVCTDNACSGVHILSVYREWQVYEQLFSSVIFVILELSTISRASEHSVLLNWTRISVTNCEHDQEQC
jgi:hypothetical protein